MENTKKILSLEDDLINSIQYIDISINDTDDNLKEIYEDITKVYGEEKTKKIQEKIEVLRKAQEDLCDLVLQEIYYNE